MCMIGRAHCILDLAEAFATSETWDGQRESGSAKRKIGGRLEVMIQ